jgi:hypothetical protein
LVATCDASSPKLIFLYDALAAGRFQTAAEFIRLLGSSEWANVSSIVDSVLTKINATNDWLSTAEDAWKFLL